MSENGNRIDQVEVSRKWSISSIWIVPFIAFVFGSYLAYKAYQDQGIYVTVKFDNASGITAGKTEVRYKGLPAGLVRTIQLDEDLQSVSVEIEMNKRTRALLGEDAVFWLVRPEVSLSGISGLETLTGGNYIGFRPGTELAESPQRSFSALISPPPLATSTPGLHILLRSDTKGSIQAGTKVLLSSDRCW